MMSGSECGGLEYEESGSDVEYCVADDDDDETLPKSSEGRSFKVITKESLIAAQNDILHHVAEMLGIKKQHARTLLIHHCWDLDRLSGDFAEKGKDTLFLEAGLPLEASSFSRNLFQRPLGDTIDCGTCYDEVPIRLISTMDCGHSFCNECWTQYFLVMVRDGQSRRIKCMEHKCNSICDEDVIKRLVFAADKEAGRKFERFLLESYIEDNGKVKWCPSVPHCGNAIHVKDEPFIEIECVCGQQFCFNCVSEPHSPCTCLMWKLWDGKRKDESETRNWLTVHTKPCPKCQKPVEKNGGCNLVACICGQAFCWLCGAATGREHNWTTIDGHSCGRYKDDREKEAMRADRDLKRYTHYHSRWQAHLNSLRLEAKQKEIVQENIAKLEESETTVKDHSWMANGLQRLYRARKALSYSYAFAFYMFGDELFRDEITPEECEISQNLFEDQQQQLEMTVEKLSKAIETPLSYKIDDHSVAGTRLHVINLTTLTDTLCKKNVRMYECVENDLLGRLHLTTQHIAKYSSDGVEKAAEVNEEDCGNSVLNKTEHDACAIDSSPRPNCELKSVLESADSSSGSMEAMVNAGGSIAVDEDAPSSRKRPRHDIDLNVPFVDSGLKSPEAEIFGEDDGVVDSLPSTSSSMSKRVRALL